MGDLYIRYAYAFPSWSLGTIGKNFIVELKNIRKQMKICICIPKLELGNDGQRGMG